MVRGATRARFLVPLAMALVLGLSGCGSPQYHYVKNSSAKTYFKVPANWKKIDQETIDRAYYEEDAASATAEARRKLTWTVAYDANQTPSPTHLYGIGTEQPYVWATIRTLSPEQEGVVSLNVMRDIFLPVTAEARQSLAEQGQQLTGFELLRDDVLKPRKGIRGVRTTYNYQLPLLPTLQTYDVTTYASDDGKLYTLIVHCSASCFKKRAGELDAIAKSFTVRNDS